MAGQGAGPEARGGGEARLIQIALPSLMRSSEDSPAAAVRPAPPRGPRVDESVGVEELANHRVLWLGKWPKELQEAVIPSKTPGGRPIPSTRIPVGERAVLDVSVRVARGELVFATVASAPLHMGESDLVFVPLTGLRPLRGALVWRRPAREPKLRAFIRVARDFLQA
jgi:hypothetical protein